jgi:TRAP-type C4-dicarboxylate transport system permease small subunit
MGNFEKFLIKILSIAIACAIMAFPVMWIWNGDLVQAVTFAKPITWSNAFGIYLLVYILGHAATADFNDKSDK